MDQPKRSPLRPLSQALEQLLATVTPLAEMQWVSTMEADARVLAQDVVSPLHVPPQDNSSMDGYALCTEDIAAPGAVLDVSQRIAAGTAGVRCRREPLRASSRVRPCPPAPTQW